MKHVAPLELVVELVDPVDLDAAAGRSGDERLRARADGPVTEVVALAPALVARLPEVQHRIVATEDGEAPVVVQDLEAEPVAVERDRRGRVPHRQRRDRLRQAHHRRSAL